VHDDVDDAALVQLRGVDLLYGRELVAVLGELCGLVRVVVVPAQDRRRSLRERTRPLRKRTAMGLLYYY